MKKIFLLIFSTLFCTLLVAQPLFKNNDVVCFMGNSITHNGRYHSYIYLYYATRFPELNLKFINCGISGDVASGMYGRLEKEVYANNATVATLSAGMNDVNRRLYTPKKTGANADSLKKKAIENYKHNVKRIADSYKEHNIKTIFFTPTIYDESEAIAAENNKGVNAALGECRDFVINIGKQYNATVVDFWKPMLDLNLKMQQSNPDFTLIGKDRIHPQATGHMVMAYLFLTQTKAPGDVWNLTIDVKKKALKTNQNCEVKNLRVKSNKISFDNKEFALPFPTIAAAKEAYNLVPITDSLNQQILKIENLKTGKYRLKINKIDVGVYSNADFSQGINLATNTNTPQYAISDSIATLVEQNFARQSIIRTLRRVEIKTMANINYANRATARAFLEKYIEEMKLQKNNPAANSGYYIMTAQTYLKEIENESTLIEKITDVEEQISKINKPQIFTYLIEKI